MPSSSPDRVGAALPFRPGAGGVLVSLRLTPKARSAGLGGLQPDADGGVMLKAAVTAVPEKGKANAALLALLAKAWGIAKSDMEIVAGETARTKTVLIRGDGAALMARLTDWYTTDKARTGETKK